MEHLSPETLARLVDESAGPDERAHLNRCRRCRDELDGLTVQTLGLSHLPDLRPPRGDWAALETRLREEGLVRERWTRGGAGSGHVPGWLQGAAAVALLVSGTAMGLGFSAVRGEASAHNPPAPVAGGPALGEAEALLAALDPAAPGDALSLDEAEDLVRLTESWYLTALLRYRDRVTEEGDAFPSDADPVARYAALEALLAAGRAAMREAPTDPFLNGLLVNMQAERDATLRGLQATTASANWY